MIIIELAYSFHLGSDKNKKNSSKASAKSNVSGTTSKSNNAIQNAKQLSDAINKNFADEQAMFAEWNNDPDTYEDKIAEYVNKIVKADRY